MQLLCSVLYAAHARGSHHKLALDALQHLRVGNAEAWRRVFLKHVKPYLDGSKAPDTEFKDFKNHVLHVGDNFWGGAPEKVESWYHLLVRALAEGNWGEAAWCAGIMSHYYADPIHPFHTAQSEAENAIHRAVEWSISRSYDTLKAESSRLAAPDVEPRSGEGWIKAFVIAGAEHSNKHYEALIAHYDFQRGVVDPPAGLDPVARQIVAGLIDYASRGIARLIDRAIVEAGVAPPEVSLTLETVLATLAVPLKLVLKKMGDAAERRQVEAMYDELMATGRVEATLPEDDRMVRDLHAREVLAKANAERSADRGARAAAAVRAQGQLFAFKEAERPVARSSERQRATGGAVPADRSAVVARRESATDAVTKPPLFSSGLASRVFLTPEQDVEAAPSIGPQMAERLAGIGVRKVGELLSADPAVLVQGLADRRVRAETVADWQDQARLVCEVAGLRGGHAQLLVGAGFRTAAEIAAADPAALQAAVLRFAATSEGQRVLRDGSPPDLERIAGWVASAAESGSVAA
ncbi:MAG: DUF4332 domain-containing protein [Hyphomicrobiaceae bacterium]